ncbi:MAG: SRPBCC family protein [Streptosporangiaceae bacterium]|nr:SRPBCC family protein [Streptosporangiaceae bacterium]MBV9857525.1 SRPBCC family protein [Streptosporangiaceae bacterium]
MSDHCVAHATFSLERTYSAAPARVFAAWAEPAAKARWFAGPDSGHRLDFRVGGREVAQGANSDGDLLTFESAYHDIVPSARIVYSSTLSVRDKVATVSVTTVEFSPAGDGTRLLLTEQGTYLDGLEDPSWREQGTSQQLDALDTELKESGTR